MKPWLFFDMGHQQWAVTALSGRYSGGAFISLPMNTTEERELCVDFQRPHSPQTSGPVKDSLCLYFKPTEPQTLILLLEFAAVATYRLGATV